MRISDWSSDVCSSDLLALGFRRRQRGGVKTAILQGSARVGCATAFAVKAKHFTRLRACRRRIELQKAILIRPQVSRRRLALQLPGATVRSEEHTSELQSLMRISYAVFCLKNKTKQ